MEKCPCGSGKTYPDCCELLIKDTIKAETARQLMQSRYTAYVKKEINYILETVLPKQQQKMDERGIRSWAEKTNWTKLEIINCTKGSVHDDTGTVEFKAHYNERGIDRKHHEIGKFKKYNNKWYYDDSDFPTPQQVVRSEPKVGRNDPCPCGSGRKYKKCCAGKQV
jgi:SEC-C motif-containing protein